VPDLDVSQLGMVDEGVVHGQRPHSRDAEEEIDALGDERLDQEMCPAS
jgi:hypothetical protein